MFSQDFNKFIKLLIKNKAEYLIEGGLCSRRTWSSKIYRGFGYMVKSNSGER